jgi:electron-transferring-flavoprotein dehydrogenase
MWLSMTNHEESQPAHLTLDRRDADRGQPAEICRTGARYCPAGSTRWSKKRARTRAFVINFQNCVHCKTCDIKDPSQNINWTTPQGGDGPNYPNM